MLFSRRELLLPSHTFSEGRNHQDNSTENLPFHVGIYSLSKKEPIGNVTRFVQGAEISISQAVFENSVMHYGY